MKRLIYGMGVVAVLLTASFSFVSCKNDKYCTKEELSELKSSTSSTFSTIDAKLKSLESDYKNAIVVLDSELRTYINAQDQSNYDKLKKFIDDNSQDIYDLGQELIALDGQRQADSALLESKISNLRQQVVDTLASYVLASDLTETLKAYVTREELKDSLNAVYEAMDELDSLIAVNAGKIQENADSIRNVASRLLALTTRVEVLETTVSSLVSTVSAAYSVNESGKIILTTEMTNAIKEAVASDIKGRADSLTNDYKKRIELASKADSLYTEQKYQQAMDSISELRKKAAIVHEQVKQIADSLHSVALSEIDRLDGEIEDLAENYNAFAKLCRQAIALLQNQIDALSKSVKELNEWRSSMQTYSLSQISSIVLQGTYNNVFGSIRLPLGLNSMLVAGHYGSMIKDVSFPNTQELGDLNPEIISMDASDEFREIPGWIYLTINPNTVNIDNVNFELVNSLDESVGFSIDSVVPCDEKLTFGWTRANNGFYKAYVSLPESTPLDMVKPRINMNDIKSALKQTFQDFKTKKEINLTTLAKALYENSSNILDASALKASWTDAFDQQFSVYSGYDVAATVFKPLGYGFDGFDKMGDSIADALESFKLKTVDPFAFEYEFNLNIDSLCLDTLTRTEYPITITLTDGSSTVINGNADMVEFLKAINATYVTSTQNKVNDMIDDIKEQIEDNVDSMVVKVNNTANTYVDKVNNYINKYNNYLTKIINKFRDTDFNHYLQPCILLEDENGHFGQVSSNIDFPTVVKRAGSNYIILTPTTYSSELLSPAMYKYLAVTNIYNTDKTVYSDASAAKAEINKKEYLMNVAFPCKLQPILYLPVSDKIYEINYQAVDFSGETRTGKYYIQSID